MSRKENEKEKGRQALLLEDTVESIEKELAEKYYQLGKGIFEAVDGRIGEINRLVDRLVDYKIELTQAMEQVSCPTCLSLSPKENLYCGKCGRHLESEEDN